MVGLASLNLAGCPQTPLSLEARWRNLASNRPGRWSIPPKLLQNGISRLRHSSSTKIACTRMATFQDFSHHCFTPSMAT